MHWRAEISRTTMKDRGYSCLCIFFFFLCVSFLVHANQGGLSIRSSMSKISDDVHHLRQQYRNGLEQNHLLKIQYEGMYFDEGNTLDVAETQSVPQVHINAEIDPNYPYFTLVCSKKNTEQVHNDT